MSKRKLKIFHLNSKKVYIFSFLFLLLILITVIAEASPETVAKIEADLEGEFILDEEANINPPITTIQIGTTTEIKKPVNEISSVKIPILAYHKVRDFKENDSYKTKAFIVTPLVFDKQMNYLKDNGYTVVSLDSLMKAFHGEPLPKKPIVITFDDGFQSQYDNALPVLQKYGFKAIFFIYTKAISSYPENMTWDELKNLSSKGMEIGAHTETHPKLTLISNRDILEEEISGGKKIIEDKINAKINYFAYPYGLNNENLRDMVKNAGFNAAVGMDRGEIQKKTDLYRLERINMNDNYKYFVKVLQ